MWLAELHMLAPSVKNKDVLAEFEERFQGKKIVVCHVAKKEGV
jgi:hypothetical protein